MPARSGSSGMCALGRLREPSTGRQITAAIAVQKVVDNGEAGLFDHARSVDNLLRHGAVLEHGGNRVERGVGRGMQTAVELRRLRINRKTAQHLSGMFPEPALI